MKACYLSFIFAVTRFLYAIGDDTITVDGDFYAIDTANRLILVNQNAATLTVANATSVSTIKTDSHYRFCSPVSTIEIGKKYDVCDVGSDTFALYFTQLPIIRIVTKKTILDEPMVYAGFVMIENNGNRTVSNIGIEYRGGYSLYSPKKSFRIEFWDDTTGSRHHNYRLCGMRNDDDWILLASYNEPLRLRNKTNHALWRLIDTLYYQKYDATVTNGIRLEYAELFLNGNYLGVYTLGEKIDRKQLNLAKSDKGSINGELYKGSAWGTSTYTSLPDFDNNNKIWGGFEYQYPDNTTDWTNIYNFVDFVMNDDSASFYEQYYDKLSIDNVVNYFIFLNLLRATDNTGKNTYVAKYKQGDPYYYVPWDLDGTFGTFYDGTRQNITDDILTNGLYTRLLKDYRPNGFVDRLEKRWHQLRQDIITHPNIMARIYENHDYLKMNGVYERESIVWKEFSYNRDDLQYISNWLQKRLVFLDSTLSEPAVAINSRRRITARDDGAAHDVPQITPDRLMYNGNDKPVAIKIVTLSGRSVFDGNIDDNNAVYFPRLAPGAYFVNLLFAERKSVITFVVK